jgi:hypothetical protein
MCCLPGWLVEAVENAEASTEFIMKIGSHQEVESMPLLDGQQFVRNLRAERQQSRPKLAQRRPQGALIIGQGEIARWAAGETKKDHHDRRVRHKLIELEDVSIDARHRERFDDIANLDVPIGVGDVDQQLPLIDVDLQIFGSPPIDSRGSSNAGAACRV